MKKLATAVIAALIVAMAAPAMAADINLGGSLETQFNFAPKHPEQDQWSDWGIEADNGLSMKLELHAGEKTKVGLEFAETQVGLDDDGALTNDERNDVPGDEENPINLGIRLDRAYLETTGAFWNGGPELTTTIGDIDVEYNDYVATLSDGNGVKIEGINYGPVNAKAFYAWDAGQAGLAVDTAYSGVELGAAVVTDGDNFEAAATAGTEISGIKVNAEGAVDRNRNYAYKVTGETEVMPNLIVKAGYRDSENFSSENAKTDDGDPVAYDNHKGFNVGLATTQYGVALEANYDQPTEELAFSADKDFELAGLNITGEYDAKYVNDGSGRPIEHKISLTSTTDMIPQLQGLELSAGVTINGDNDENNDSWNVGADYEAPNGMNFGAKYDSEEGPSAYAGLKVEF